MPKIGSIGQNNIQETAAASPSISYDTDFVGETEQRFNIFRDKLPIKSVYIEIQNMHYRGYLDKLKSAAEVSLPSCSSDSKDFDLLTGYEDDPLDRDYMPSVKVKTSSNIKSTMVKKKSPEKWIISEK